MADNPTVVELRVHGVSGTSITVGNTRSCAVCSTTGLTHARTPDEPTRRNQPSESAGPESAPAKGSNPTRPRSR